MSNFVLIFFLDFSLRPQWGSAGHDNILNPLNNFYFHFFVHKSSAFSLKSRCEAYTIRVTLTKCAMKLREVLSEQAEIGSCQPAPTPPASRAPLRRRGTLESPPPIELVHFSLILSLLRDLQNLTLLAFVREPVQTGCDLMRVCGGSVHEILFGTRILQVPHQCNPFSGLDLQNSPRIAVPLAVVWRRHLAAWYNARAAR